jgi:hypothetical protein
MRRRRSLLRVLLVGCAALVACDKTPPTPQPEPQPPGTVETITGRERIGWDQQAADRVELASFRYALYIDGARTELSDAACSNDPGSAGFACTVGLPALSLDNHVLELAAFLVDGGTVAESPRSSASRQRRRLDRGDGRRRARIQASGFGSRAWPSLATRCSSRGAHPARGTGPASRRMSRSYPMDDADRRARRTDPHHAWRRVES